ncbi:glycosyltransferase family 2 protein [Christiangramia echinicola]|uniref:glycosyltransferase family 2 protein n=1 Tax=Christiangramia echinicola TaxID=279359 RepID=UPI000423BCCB|nr:glycosyltransferase family 2 protein [Christiangramia echinicola]
MTVSVIIPTYNRLEMLKEAIDSVLNQTRLPDEIIIGDDSNNNLTKTYINKELILKSEVPIRYFHHEPSLKQGRNVEFILNKAACDLCMLLHDDDLLMPDCIKTLIKPLEENPEVVASYGDQIFIHENGKEIKDSFRLNKKYYRTPERQGIVEGKWASVVQMFPNDAFLVRTKAALKTGYFANGRAGDAVDFYFGYRLGEGNKFFYVNRYTAKYRMCTESVSGSGSTNFMSATLKVLLQEIDTSMRETPEVRKKIRQLMNPAISEVIRGGDKNLALKWMTSKYYNLFSLRGFKRIMMLVIPYRS